MSDRPELDSVPDDQGLARLLIANALDIIVILNADGTLRFASPSMKRVLGYWPTDLVGKNVLGLVHSEDAPAVRERFSHRVQHAGPGQPMEFRFRHQDGSWRSLEAMATNRLDDPRIAGLIVTCRDITDRKRVQEVGAQLVQEHTARAEAEAAVKARDIFVAIASHELRTPLTVLSGTGQLLLRDLDRSEAIDVQQMRERLNVMLDQTSKLNNLVSQLLDVSRLETGQLALDRRVTDLVALAKQTVELTRTSTGRRSIELRAPDSLIALVDPLRLEQVLTNLLQNAVKFSPTDSQIDVEVEQPSPERVQVAVRDRGSGILPEHRERLFEPFYQAHSRRRRSGLGLGLYITRQIVERHGGRIEVEFPDDGGTRFVVSLHRSLVG